MDHSERLMSQLGIHCIRLPNSYSDIESNCYFIENSTPTLIDTGIGSEGAFRILVEELSRMDRRVKDIRRILLTHGHADHRALAPKIQEESGAELLYHRSERTKVMVSEKMPPERDAQLEYFRSAGVPEELLPGLVDGSTDPAIRAKATSATALAGGEEIHFDSFSLKAVHTPGHSSGSICFLEERQGLLFSGDTMLPTSRVTALMELDLLGRKPEYNPLAFHLESLRRLEELQPSCVLPGHGDTFSDYVSINDEIRERHRKRRKHILRALRHEAKTPYQICRSIFPLNSQEDLFLMLSEVIGNIGILMDEGAIEQRRDGRVLLFAKAE